MVLPPSALKARRLTKKHGHAAALGRRDDDVVSIKADIMLIKGLMALLAALQVAIFVKLFIH